MKITCQDPMPVTNEIYSIDKNGNAKIESTGEIIEVECVCGHCEEDCRDI